MPNIMICGYADREARLVRHTVDEIVRELGLENEAITSIVEMKTKSCGKKRKHRPYLRICSTSLSEIKEILTAFKAHQMGIDVEWLVLGGFVPAVELT